MNILECKWFECIWYKFWNFTYGIISPNIFTLPWSHSSSEEEVLENEQALSQTNEKNVYLQHQILEAEKTKKILQRQKGDIEENIKNLEKSNAKSKVDIKNFNEIINTSQLQLKEFEN